MGYTANYECEFFAAFRVVCRPISFDSAMTALWYGNTFRMLDLCEGKPAVISHVSKYQPIMFHETSWNQRKF